MIIQLSRILAPSRCLASVAADSRKRVLETISRQVASELDDVGAMNIFDLFIARERLGSTAIGHGVAIPHIRFAALDQPMAVVCQLTQPIDYDAKDGQAVDLFFALLVPEDADSSHLAILSQVADLLSDPDRRAALRAADSEQRLYQHIVDYERDQQALDDELPGLDNTDDTT